MSESKPIPELQPLILETTEMLTTLHALLLKEREAVKTRDLESMQQCNAEKSALLVRIERNFQQRQMLLGNAGIAPTADAWQAYLDNLPASHSNELSDAWQALADTLEQTQQANQVNHQLIHRSRESNDRLLNLLQGKNQRSELYGNSGKRNNFATQSRLGKA